MCVLRGVGLSVSWRWLGPLRHCSLPVAGGGTTLDPGCVRSPLVVEPGALCPVRRPLVVLPRASGSSARGVGLRPVIGRGDCCAVLEELGIMGRALRTGSLGEVLEPPTKGATLRVRRAVGLSPACTQELPTVALQKECVVGTTYM